MNDENRQVLIRVPNDDNGTYIHHNAILVSENLAYAIFDEQLEIHIVSPTDEHGVYDLSYASNAMFYVGGCTQEVFNDLQTMNLLEFAAKYVHSDFYVPPENLA